MLNRNLAFPSPAEEVVIRMDPDTDSVTAIEEWFSQQFPEQSIHSADIKWRDVYLFRAQGSEAGAPRYELEVSYEALEDHGVTIILGDLEAQGAVHALKDAPDIRLMYDRHRNLVTTDRHS